MLTCLFIILLMIAILGGLIIGLLTTILENLFAFIIMCIIIYFTHYIMK